MPSTSSSSVSTAGSRLYEAGERVAGDDLAVVDDDDAVAQALGLFHVVRGVEQRLAATAQRLEVVEDGVAALRIDADGRLVEDQDVGIVDQRGGDVEAPLHAAAEGLRLVAGAVGQADQLRAPRRRARAAARRRGRRARRTAPGWRRRRGSRRSRAPAARRRCGAWRRARSRSAPSAIAPLPTKTSPRSAPTRPQSIATVVDLPAPFGPSRPTISPAPTLERQVGDDGAVAVRFAKASGFEHRILLVRNERDSSERPAGGAGEATDRRRRGANGKRPARTAHERRRRCER